MAGNIKRVNAVAAQPWLIYTTDTAVQAFLRSLCGTGAAGTPADAVATLSDAANDFGATDEAAALWATPVLGDPTHGGETGGTAFIVSAEAMKRIDAHRYTGG